jgi:hypothetical protein
MACVQFGCQTLVRRVARTRESNRASRLRFILCLAMYIMTPRAWAAEPAAEQIEFFEKRIRPVLVKNCYACHSAAIKSPMGGLRLDTREALFRGGSHGPAIRAGDPDGSLLFQALAYRGDVRMPPSGRLPDDQLADFAAWIRMGAPDPRLESRSQSGPGQIDFAEARQFWSFRPVERVAIPGVNRKSWIRSPIDVFIVSKLEAAGIEPASPADKETLIRRVTYDLTGLPPTPQEIDDFLADPSPQAFERVVERLLASPRYGERWARHWLDLVRYAETNGHEFDNDKLEPWRYRDYVIRAFNQDVPYDQFVREHMAGDLLATKRLSTDGSIAESPVGTGFFWFGEVLNSATDSVKSRADLVDNQIDVTGKAFLGLTVACARCHNHKFDPIPTADYYALAGVFHSTDLREAVVDSPERSRKIGQISQQIREINRRIEGIQGSVEKSPDPIAYRPEDSVFMSFGSGSFGTWTTTGAAFADGPVGGAASSLAAGSEKFVGTLTSPKFQSGDKRYLHVRLSGTKSDVELRERGLLRFTMIADGYKGQHLAPEGGDRPGWQTLSLILERNRTCAFEIVDLSREGHISVSDIVFSDLKDPPPVRDGAPESRVAHANVSAEDEEQLRRLESEREQLEAQIPESAFAMLATDYQPHDVRIHLRGNHQNLGDEVPRGFLKVVAAEDQAIRNGSGRLEIAEALASDRNPLTARVMVNRIWEHHFGRGIVKTPDNFGATGARPTHPELLDYLASRFVESGWSVKAMHRLMLLSSTYQMASQASGRAATVDPENNLFHRMPVRRLEAEAIRDAILLAAGTLDATMYGPSIPPFISTYQEGRGKPDSGPMDGDRRRSIYIQVRRNFLTPFFLAFDYPLPTSSVGARSVSTVPSQALLLMNNEFVAQQAGEWARRAMALNASAEDRIDFLYRAAFSRRPESSEIGQILKFLDSQAKLYQASGTVEPSALSEQVWTDVAHVLLNSPEFLYIR